jgi:hypothetical protein
MQHIVFARIQVGEEPAFDVTRSPAMGGTR